MDVMRKIPLLILTLLLSCTLVWQGCADDAVSLRDLRCENLENPLAIDNVNPHFSWKLEGRRSSYQQAYEIQVGTDSLRLSQGNADLWDSGRTVSRASVMVPYQGGRLKSRELCYWRVRVEDDKGRNSAWSPVQRFAIGVLEEEGDTLRGDFISMPGGEASSPLLRKSFTAEGNGKTFLHVNSLGYHEAYVNGMKADASVLSPGV